MSIEPVIDPKQALELIKKYHPIVDHWKIGKINYHPEVEEKVDWIRFREEVKSLLESLGADHYLKKSLTDLTDPESQRADVKKAAKTSIQTGEGKMAKPELPAIEDNIKIIPGDTRILLIAPHGVMGDDDNTDILTFEVQKRLECYAIVNDVFQRDIRNFNSYSSISKHPEFIKTIKEVVETPRYTLVVWIHGIEDVNADKEAKAKDSDFNGKPKDLHALVGYGQGPNPMVPPKARADEDKKSSPTVRKKTAEAFRNLLINKDMPTILTRDKAKKYRGREPDNMNQWFLKEGYNFEQVESLQLEIRMTPTRLKKNIATTAEIIANTLSELVPLVKEVDDVLVDRAYQWLANRFRQHIANFMLEAGHYIIYTFYGGDQRAAFAKNKTKEQPPSLKRLIEKIRQSSKSPYENAPSIGWLYNAVNLAAHEAICEQEGLQTFGILGHSHKLQLLHVPKLKQIEKDKFDEAIGPAFQEKERLASVAVEKKLSVRGFKAYINEEHPEDSGTLDLTELPPLNELRQRESKELLRLWNLAKSKIDEGQKMMGVYSKAIHKLGTVLAEKNTNAELGKGRFQDWTKSKNNVNICTGCKNDCVYCYMKPMNTRNPKLKQPEDWHNWELRQNDVNKNYGLRDGLVGFPSSHDIFPDILDASLTVLGKILRAGNEVLIVSKPRLECIKAICAASTFFKDKIIFRFTIGAMSADILSYWEPDAPKYDERKACLEYAFHMGFRTSVSMEPMLDSPNIENLVNDLLPFVSEDIWLGTMNHLGWFKKRADKLLLAELDIIEAGQTPEMLLAIDKIYENNSKIKWKTDALKIIEGAKKRESNIQKSTELMDHETYTDSEWNGAIASMGRLVDIRNFPDVAADVLLGKRKAFLGQGYKGETKALNPEIIGALVFWTKGPAELLIENPGLREVLELYNRNHAVVGLQLSVTGFGGTLLEPGIQSPEEVAVGLEKVLETGLISPEAVQLRYDPLIRVEAPDGRILKNDTAQAFEKVASLFSKLGIKVVETKFLLLGEKSDDKYHHVWKRMQEAGVIHLPVDDISEVYSRLSEVVVKYNMQIFSCCVKEEQNLPGWVHDSGCLSANRLTNAAKKRFGEDWDRLSTAGRSSRGGCMCSRYFDLSNIKGHKKCGSQDAACIYCTSSSEVFGKTIRDKLASEIEAFKNGERDDYYKHLMDSD